MYTVPTKLSLTVFRLSPDTLAGTIRCATLRSERANDMLVLLEGGA